MSNEFYQPGEQRAARVNDLFGAIARRYDLLNDLQSFGLHRLWKRRLVRLAAVRPGERALDVCCGTGDLAFALAQRGASVVGLDFSAPMLEVAEHRRRRTSPDPATTGLGGSGSGPSNNPRFMEGDAQQLPFADESFELATVGYGLRNLASWERGLEEMARVLAPGGRLLVLDFGRPDNRLWRWVYFNYLRLLVPVLGRAAAGNAAAYAYILESLRHYPAQPGVTARLRSLGLDPVRLIDLLGGVMSIHRADKPPARLRD